MTEVPKPADAGVRTMMNEAEVLKKIPVSRVTLWRMEKEGRFPRSTYVSANRRFWFADEIAKWQETVDARKPNRGLLDPT